MNVRVVVFAKLRELLGRDAWVVDMPDGSTVRELLLRVADAAPSGWQSQVLCAVNQQYAGEETVLRDGDELALIPPVAGG